MSRRVYGEATFETGGQSYRLVLSMYAWSLAQDALSKGNEVPSLEQISERLKAGSARYANVVFWAMLQKYHAPQIRTEEHAMELLEMAGAAAAHAMSDAFRAAAPDPKDLQELAGENPPKARVRRGNGTGETQSSPPSLPA